jgi:hypothetical protein
MLSRRSLLLAAAASAMLNPAAAATARPLKVYKTADCTCCEGWVAAMARAGFAPESVASDNIAAVWRRHGVPDSLSSCHLGLVGSYVLVGHVPPADALRLLKERPKAIGLTVPGMPWGSPGMEAPDRSRQRFDTLVLLPGGRTRVFARNA